LRSSLILTTKWVVSFFGINAVRTDEYVLRIPDANGIRIVYSCLGFGVMSFWIAYMVATLAKIKSKVKWLFGGLILIFTINVIRISMVLVSGNKGWRFPLGWDHHTWFNIVAYCAIFAMMYFFEKEIKKVYTHGS
ncbi:MAG: exosortase/archaeosortase family protein, partial [Ferruginibacter sp.]|nr:exosortase/archaeosortase family protein [Ferruginibacter sp.]